MIMVFFANEVIAISLTCVDLQHCFWKIDGRNRRLPNEILMNEDSP